MNDFDDEGLDDALRALGTPAAGQPAATATDILAGAAAAAPVAVPSGGVGIGATTLGAALVAALGAGGVLGFGVAAALILGFDGEPAGAGGGGAPTAVAAAPAPAREAPSGGDGEALPASARRAPSGGDGEALPASARKAPSAPAEALPASARKAPTAADGSDPAPSAPADAVPASARKAPTAADGRDPAPSAPADAVPASARTAPMAADADPLPASARTAPTAAAIPPAEPAPSPTAEPGGRRHEAARTLAVGLRATRGGPAWEGTIDGVAPEIGAAFGVVAAGGPLRPRLRADLALGLVDARATAASSAQAGFSADLGPARLDVGGAVGVRWIAASPGAATPYDDEAGWLVLGAGPSAALVLPRRGPDLFVAAEALYSSLSFGGRARRVPWIGISAGLEIHGSARARLYR